MVPLATEVAIAGRASVEEARRAARALVVALGFGPFDAEMIVLAAIELATNLQRYARDGSLLLYPLAELTRVGIELVSSDCGPGIPDIPAALRDGFSTGGGLGAGLPAVRRLMDDFTIVSDPHCTRITARKWHRTA